MMGLKKAAGGREGSCVLDSDGVPDAGGTQEPGGATAFLNLRHLRKAAAPAEVGRPVGAPLLCAVPGRCTLLGA